MMTEVCGRGNGDAGGETTTTEDPKGTFFGVAVTVTMVGGMVTTLGARVTVTGGGVNVD